MIGLSKDFEEIVLPKILAIAIVAIFVLLEKFKLIKLEAGLGKTSKLTFFIVEIIVGTASSILCSFLCHLKKFQITSTASKSFPLVAVNQDSLCSGPSSL